MTVPGQIFEIDPEAAIPGGELLVQYTPLSAKESRSIEFRAGSESMGWTAVGLRRALVRAPAGVAGAVRITTATEETAEIQSSVTMTVGASLAGDLHPVANPAFDPADGALLVTRSGSRGESVPVSIFRIDKAGKVEAFAADIMNPTAIAFDRLGRMTVTSRFDGGVYRISRTGEVVAVAHDLGVATGLAFNREGEMFVGDRSGTIYRVNEIGNVTVWAEHEPSVSAYHLAFGGDEALYLSGPTVCGFDAIVRFDEHGNPANFYRGLGRPQGMAFDNQGNLYVAASLRGRRGIVRITPDGRQAELVVAGMNVVGLAFGPAGEMMVATNHAVYKLALGIHGSLLR